MSLFFLPLSLRERGGRRQPPAERSPCRSYQEQQYRPGLYGLLSYHETNTIHILCMRCKLSGILFFFGMLFSGVRVFFVPFSAAGQAMGPSVHYEACLDRARRPWRVF